MRHSILNGIVYSIFNRFLIDLGCPGASKIIKITYENSTFGLLGNFNIRSLLNTILVPTWPHFGSKRSIESGLGRVLARLGGLLGRLEGALESSWAVLDRLGQPSRPPKAEAGRRKTEKRTLRSTEGPGGSPNPSATQRGPDILAIYKANK